MCSSSRSTCGSGSVPGLGECGRCGGEPPAAIWRGGVPPAPAMWRGGVGPPDTPSLVARPESGEWWVRPAGLGGGTRV